MEEEIISGIIEGQEKDTDVLSEYMLSTVSSIKEELLLKYPQETSEYYIYTRYNQKERILYIFITLLKNSKVNYRENNISFLMVITEEYPNKPPYVFCLSDFISTINIFDMRNIQQNLIFKWNSSNKISELIDELPNFCNNFEYQVSQGLLPNIGLYYINTHKYDINDFMRNNNNGIYKVLIPNKNEDKNKTIFYKRYFIITSVCFIIAENINERYKNICRVNYVGDIFEINKIDKFIITEDDYKDLSCFKIKWNKNYNNKLTITMCGDTKSFVVKNLTQCLEERKDYIKNNFNLIQKNDDANIKVYEEIIKIKEKLVEDKINDCIYEEINTLYQKIIEVLSSLNGKDFKIYVEKLQKFIDLYNRFPTSRETFDGMMIGQWYWKNNRFYQQGKFNDEQMKKWKSLINI